MKRYQNACSGQVMTLRGHVVAATGKVTLGGEHVLRPGVERELGMAGARVITKVSGQISLLVHGDLSGQIVKDLTRKFSEKIIRVIAEDAFGHHVCVVSSRGLDELLIGRPAKCLHDHIVRQ